MKRFWPFLLILVAAVFIVLMRFCLPSTPSIPHVSLHVVRSTNDPAGRQTVFFLITNSSRKEFVCSYATQVLTNGIWTPADSVLEKRTSTSRYSLAARSGFEAAVSAPRGVRWRVLAFSVSVSDSPYSLRTQIDDLFGKNPEIVVSEDLGP